MPISERTTKFWKCVTIACGTFLTIFWNYCEEITGRKPFDWLDHFLGDGMAKFILFIAIVLFVLWLWISIRALSEFASTRWRRRKCSPIPTRQDASSRRMYLGVVDGIAAGLHPLEAIKQAGAAELDTNDDLSRLCAHLVANGLPDPFADSPFPETHRLEVLKCIRDRGLSVTRESYFQVLLDVYDALVGSPAKPERAPVKDVGA